jgi:transposase
MEEIFVGLDLHLRKTQGTAMLANGRIIKQDRFESNREKLKEFLQDFPKGTKVALECLGFCWPWIDFIESLGYDVKLANPLKIKQRAEDVKSDKIDSEILAHLLRVNWLPTSYLPSKEMRLLRNILRHRLFRVKLLTALKNRTWSEFRKRNIDKEIPSSLKTKKGRELAISFEIYEVDQNIHAINLLDLQVKRIEKLLMNKYSNIKPVKILQKIPGIGLITALTLYAEICDIERFSSPEKLAKYAGLVPRVKQTSEYIKIGRETKGNKWLKWILIEASWSHLRLLSKWKACKSI